VKLIVGVDEVGYGSIAGPLVVAAVAFRSDTRKPVLKRVKRKDMPVKDSKLISHNLLPLFQELIEGCCEEHVIWSCTPGLIDKVGVSEARREAIVVAVTRLLQRVAFEDFNPDTEDYRVIVDGDLDLGTVPFKYKAKPKADRDIWQVSAASILAKAAQIRAMRGLVEKNTRYAKYGWDRNHGYGTAEHIAAIQEHGVTQHHRRSYKTIRELL
jgi:ribonuclease HII